LGLKELGPVSPEQLHVIGIERSADYQLSPGCLGEEEGRKKTNIVQNLSHHLSGEKHTGYIVPLRRKPSLVREPVSFSHYPR
jgi:hypothetical protein